MEGCLQSACLDLSLCYTCSGGWSHWCQCSRYLLTQSLSSSRSTWRCATLGFAKPSVSLSHQCHLSDGLVRTILQQLKLRGNPSLCCACDVRCLVYESATVLQVHFVSCRMPNKSVMHQGNTGASCSLLRHGLQC